MKNSKRPMTKRHEPHDQNKTPHEEINLTAAVAERPPYHFGTELSCMGKGIFLHSLSTSPVLPQGFPCIPK